MQSSTAESVAVFFGAIGALFGGLIAYDLAKYLLLGRESTISFGMWQIGSQVLWFPVAVTLTALGVVVGLAVHFWYGSTSNKNKE